MKHFLAFYNSQFDPSMQAQTYADEAEAHARAIGCQISSKIVDVLGQDPDKQYWDSPNTIECVMVDGTTKKETVLNPSALTDIDSMIDRLCQST